MQWALDHQRCRNPKSSNQGPYSTDPNDYDSLCVPCHKRMDLARLKANLPKTPAMKVLGR